MTLDKKQKKRLEVARKKLLGLTKLLSDLKAQPDDLDEIRQTQAEVDKLQAEIKSIQAEG